MAYQKIKINLIIKCMMPYFLHIIPISDDSMLNRILQGQYTSFGLGLISNISILFWNIFFLIPDLMMIILPTFWSMPTMIPGCFGRPTMEGNTARGASSPAKPAYIKWERIPGIIENFRIYNHLTHSWPIIYYKCLNIFVRHLIRSLLYFYLQLTTNFT